jgi:hypothetical protein
MEMTMLRRWRSLFVKSGQCLSARQKRSHCLPGLEELEDRTALSSLTASAGIPIEQTKDHVQSSVQDTQVGKHGGQNSNSGPGYPTTGPLAAVSGPLLTSNPATAVFLPPSTQGTQAGGFHLLFPALLNAVPGRPAAQDPVHSFLRINDVLGSANTSNTLPLSNAPVQGESTAASAVPNTAADKVVLVMDPSTQANPIGQLRQDAVPTRTAVGPEVPQDVSNACYFQVKVEELPIVATSVFGTGVSAVDEPLVESIPATIDPALAQSTTNASSEPAISDGDTDIVWTTRRVSLSLAPLGLLAGYLFVSSKVPHQKKQEKLQLPKPE